MFSFFFFELLPFMPQFLSFAMRSNPQFGAPGSVHRIEGYKLFHNIKHIELFDISAFQIYSIFYLILLK